MYSTNIFKICTTNIFNASILGELKSALFAIWRQRDLLRTFTAAATHTAIHLFIHIFYIYYNSEIYIHMYIHL